MEHQFNVNEAVMIFEKKYFTEQATASYIECLLWTGTDDEGEPLDGIFGREAIAPKALAEIAEDVADFVDANWADVKGMSAAQTGHDFALTRNGHGAGFWDRGLGELGDRLTRAAKVYGSQDLFAGDDGALYV